MLRGRRETQRQQRGRFLQMIWLDVSAGLETLAVPVINFYDRKLIFSGYDHDERLRIIEAGITSYHGKLDSVREGEEFYRVGKDTLAIRTRRNLLEKMSWYKDKTWNTYMKGKTLAG